MASKFAESLYLKGIIESTNVDLLTIREQMLKQKTPSLGPPDLILLTKKTDNPQYPFVKSFHCISGLTISCPSSFAAYFASLLKLIPQNVLGVPKFSLTEGVLFCYNAFSNIDIQITVKNPGSCTYTYDSGDQVYNISELTWYELSICTTLRFWRTNEPIFSMLFGVDFIAAPIIREVMPQPISVDDIKFAVNALKPSSETNFAITNAIISMKNRDLAMDLIRELLPVAPRIISGFLKYFPSKSPIFSEVKNCIIDAYYVAPDDINLAVVLVQVCLYTGDMQKCSLATPLLLASLWNEPMACIALAQICRVSNLPDGALFFLNAACLSREPAWKSGIMTLPTSSTTKEKGALKTEITEIEKYLCVSHLCGASYYFHRAIADLSRDLGPIKLQTMLKYKSFTAKSLIPQIPELSYYVNKEESKGAGAGAIPQPDTSNLYDPGISSEPYPPKVIERLPTSQKLIDAAEYVLHDLSFCDNIKRNQQFPNDFEAMKACIIGLRVGELEAVDIALKAVKSPSLFADLLKMRYMCETHWTSLSNIFHAPNKNTTLNEANSVFVAKAIAVGLESFII
jgi:hypothetical protein